jgi:hypothetical protein
MTCRHPLLTYVELFTCGISRRIWSVQNPDPNQELRHAKIPTLTLEKYQDIVNYEVARIVVD